MLSVEILVFHFLGWMTGTNSLYLNSFAMDSEYVGKAILVKLSYTTLGIEQRTFSYLRSFSYHKSVC